MLYIIYRHLICLCSTLVAGLSILLIIFFQDPAGFAAIGKTQTFDPVVSLLHLSTIALVMLSIIASHPFTADGEETLHMRSPFTHAAVQGNIAAIISIALLQKFAMDSNIRFFSREIIAISAYLLKVAAVSTATCSVGFYTLKHRARIKRRRGEDLKAFCIKSSF